MTEDTTTVTGLDEAIKHVEKAQAEALSKVNKFNQNFLELTGYQPNQPITALDVYKIFDKLAVKDD